MLTDPMMFAWFAAVSSLVMLVYLLVGGRKRASQPDAEEPHRGRGIFPTRDEVAWRPRADGSAPSELPADYQVDPTIDQRARREEKHRELKQRMVHAGLYGREVVGVFLALRFVLVLGLTAVGFFASRLGYLKLSQGLLLGLGAGIVGTLAPGMWLNARKQRRQTKLRRALPDALDVMVICLEGGLSLTGALARVAREMATAHPLLAVELNIVERQIQMGQPAGAAIREMANRFDLEELRSVASVVTQSERIGSSVVNAMKVFAETLRVRRHQRAEELAHKAGVKLLFPTLIFIFPAIFVVILGPAAIQIYQNLILKMASTIAH